MKTVLIQYVKGITTVGGAFSHPKCRKRGRNLNIVNSKQKDRRSGVFIDGYSWSRAMSPSTQPAKSCK